MAFDSPLFLFLFLPLVLGLNLAFSRFLRGGRNLFLLSASALFYAWSESFLVLVMLGSAAVDYFCGLAVAGGRSAALAKGGKRTRQQKAAVVVSVCVNLLVLAYFKYADFGLVELTDLLGDIGIPVSTRGFPFWKGALPLGISFYTFQSMSYTIDVYRGEVTPTRSFIDFTCFVTLFPQLIAGPIVRYRDIAAQLVDRKVSLDGFARGVRRFLIGLAKKVLIADALAGPAQHILNDMPADQLGAATAWLGVLAYTLRIYFDFSGYSDMAIGLGRMLGFKFPENFDYPYASRSLREFWRRWHITLSSWFRDYLYIPLGGGRRGSARVAFNLGVVFLLCGLWHGANWNFIAWGLFHGAFLMLERTRFGEWVEEGWNPLRHLYVLLVVMGGWVLFATESLARAGSIFEALAGFGRGLPDPGINLSLEAWLMLAAGTLGALPVIPLLAAWTKKLSSEKAAWMKAASVAALIALMLLSWTKIFGEAQSPFLYYRF